MPNEPLIAVIGADGFVGGGFANGLPGSVRVVYAPASGNQVHISQAEALLRNADVIINAGGFRVRRGLTYRDYQRCYAEANALFLPWVRKGALFIHMSSAHVLGKSRRERLGNDASPNPATYPSAAYALAKLEADAAVEQAALQHDFRAILLWPTILYARPGDTSLPTAYASGPDAERSSVCIHVRHAIISATSIFSLMLPDGSSPGMICPE